MNFRHICTAGMIAHHGLLTAHEALSAGVEDVHMQALLIRHIVLEIANVADLAAISGAMYKDDPDLGELYRPICKSFMFFKYIRNIYVGHFNADLTDKTFEWMPFTNVLIGSVGKNDQLIVSLFALEAALNTYADTETGHKIFNSETDLNYPPDRTRFLNYLGDTAVGTIDYAAKLITVTRKYFDVSNYEEEWRRLSLEAGATNFSILTKGKR